MDLFALIDGLLAFGPSEQEVIAWLEWAFYPSLLGILVVASLGVPIPEDIPLIAAGVILKTHPDVASWHMTFLVALVGIMTGDLVLYTLGRFFGPSIVSHRYIRWLVTPARFQKVVISFRKHGVWAVFFGRFFMGIRAMMCMAAGTTRFPYWKFFLADLSGAVLSIPLFIVLGYLFADALPLLREWLVGVQGALIGTAIVAGIVLLIVLKVRWQRRLARESTAEQPPIASNPSDSSAA